MPTAFFIMITGFVLFIDQISKYLLKNVNMLLIPGILKLTGTKNTGLAFGLLSGNTWLLPLLTSLVIIFLMIYIITSKPQGMMAFGLSLILGGAIGNLIDRLFHGFVIDFFELLFVRFAVFNMADIAITIGCALCFIAVLISKEESHA